MEIPVSEAGKRKRMCVTKSSISWGPVGECDSTKGRYFNAKKLKYSQFVSSSKRSLSILGGSGIFPLIRRY